MVKDHLLEIPVSVREESADDENVLDIENNGAEQERGTVDKTSAKRQKFNL